ncbi:MAG TPA: magnesium/cobalt transporter CorA [Longimicrobiales bacterium]|nr:magnesium/cobalt transporter CorA [Longimicrobiales bacterium]
MATKLAPFDWKPAELADTPTRIRAIYQTRDGDVRADVPFDEIVKLFQSNEGKLWLDIEEQSAGPWTDLAKELGLHPLTIEDTLSPESRIKIEEYDSYLFAVVRDANFNAKTPDPYDFETCNLYMFIGHTFLITVHSEHSQPIVTLNERLAVGPEIMNRGIDYLTYAVLDTLVDSYFPMLDEIDDFIDELETQIFENNDSKETLSKVFALKRTLLALRKHQAPLREILATMANRPTQYLAPSTQIYFRDVYDHVVRQVESIETYRDLLTGALEIHFSVMSTRMNEAMKALTVVGTFLLPATWIASIYGMNFEWMPWLHHPLGFWVALVFMFALSFVLWGWLKIKHWV